MKRFRHGPGEGTDRKTDAEASKRPRNWATKTPYSGWKSSERTRKATELPSDAQITCPEGTKPAAFPPRALPYKEKSLSFMPGV